jgi:hypothetical protein
LQPEAFGQDGRDLPACGSARENGDLESGGLCGDPQEGASLRPRLCGVVVRNGCSATETGPSLRLSQRRASAPQGRCGPPAAANGGTWRRSRPPCSHTMDTLVCVHDQARLGRLCRAVRSRFRPVLWGCQALRPVAAGQALNIGLVNMGRRLASGGGRARVGPRLWVPTACFARSGGPRPVALAAALPRRARAFRFRGFGVGRGASDDGALLIKAAAAKQLEILRRGKAAPFRRPDEVEFEAFALAALGAPAARAAPDQPPHLFRDEA